MVSYEPTAGTPDGAPVKVQRFSDLYREVAAMSRFLVEETGLRRGDRVAIFKSNDQRCFRWFLAIIRAGGVAVPLNPMLTLVELKAIVSRCQVSTLVTDRAVFEGAIGSREALDVRHWVQSGDEAPLDGFLRFTAEWLQAPPAPPAVSHPPIPSPCSTPPAPTAPRRARLFPARRCWRDEPWPCCPRRW